MINKDKITIIGDATPPAEKGALELFKESGIDTFVLYPNETDHYGAIERCGEAGLDVFPFGGSPICESNAKYFADAVGKFPNYFERYRREGADLDAYPQVRGLYMIDEPGADLFAQIREIYVPWFNERYAGKKRWHVNMLPSYSTDEQLGVTARAGETIYETFLDRYVEQVQKAVKGTKSLGVDHYPMREKQGKISLSEDWLFDLAVAGNAARRSDSIFSVCIQVFCTEGLARVQSKADVSFQFYTGMAFGASMFEIYAYTTSHGFEAMLFDDGTPSPAYGFVRDAVRELRSLEKEYLKYDFRGVRCCAPAGERVAAFDKIRKYQAEEIVGLREVTVTGNTLVSQFTDEAGKHAYLFVNYGMPSLSESNRVTAAFDRAREAVVFANGDRNAMPLENGKITLLLDPGQGVFVIPEQ